MAGELLLRLAYRQLSEKKQEDSEVEPTYRPSVAQSIIHIIIAVGDELTALPQCSDQITGYHFECLLCWN